ncbi:hypothetical protein JMN23_13480 [Bacillus sp. RHFB]|nr:hypothetical protein [Bacillus sp. RHFB]
MKKYEIGFVVTGSVMTIVFLILINFLTSSQYPWFIYPVLAVLLFSLGLYCVRAKKYTLFSVLGSFLLLLCLIIVNYINTPGYPWFSYTVGPIVMWPALVIQGQRAKTMTTALIGSISFILYYILLNIFLAPQVPWVIFPAFVILWWPLSLYHVQQKSYFGFSISASLFISVFFISVNAIFSPQEVWAVYPIFAVLWWPLSMYYFSYRQKK